MEWGVNFKLSQKSLLNSSVNPFLKNIYPTAEPNIIIKNRYVKIKKNIPKINLRQINIHENYVKNNFELQTKRSESSEFITKFIKCQKQKLAYKIQPTSSEAVQQILFYIKSKSSCLQQNQQQQPMNSSYFQQRNYQNNNRQPVRQIKTTTRISGDQNDLQIHSADPRKRQTKTRSTVCSQVQKSSPRTIKKVELKTPFKLKMQQAKQQMRTIQDKNLQTKKNRALIPYDMKELAFIKSQSYAIMQYPSNQLIISFRSKISLQIASLTKIMTCYLIIKLAQEKKIDIYTQTIQIQDFVQDITGTSADLLFGDIMTIQNLLYALMLPSGNDAATCLADWGGKILNGNKDKKQNIKAFVKQMNKRAKILGLTNTRYGNPHGLPSNQGRSCAFDICRLTSICMQIPIFNKVINTQFYKCNVKTTYNVERQVIWQNTNKLLRRNGFLGVKTGITVTAGPCLASAYKFKDRTFIIVLLRANKVSRRFTQTRKILYWTLKRLFNSKLNRQDQKILQQLYKRDRDLDSDNSDDEKQFVYNNGGADQYVKRKKILKYEL